MKMTSIEGDMALGRHAAIGGNASIKGSARVGHNLKVDGWLDAPNVVGCDKGLHPTLAALAEAYPRPRRGWWALVGEELPAELCVVVGGQWTLTGKHAGGSGFGASGLEEAMDAIEALEARVGALEEAVEKLEEGRLAAGFDAIVNSLPGELKEQTAHASSEPECSVVYVNALGRFVLKIETLSLQGGASASYYGTWADNAAYADAEGSPLATMIYVCRANGQAYRWTGAALVAI